MAGELHFMPAPMVSGLMAETGEVVLRGQMRHDGLSNRSEAEEMLAVDARRSVRAQEWYGQLVEAVSDYAVFAEAPAGSLSFCTAEWLVGCLAPEGRLREPVCLEIAIRTMEKARSCPPMLSAFALEQVAKAAIDGEAGLTGAEKPMAGMIEKAEVDLVRRILYAYGGDAAVAVTRAEADVLLRINDRTVEEMNHASWNDLFVKAIANSVFAASGYAVPPRPEALRREAMLDHADADLSHYFARMISGGLGGLVEIYRAGADQGSAEPDELADARWLAERLSQDRLLHDNERALFGLFARGPRLHPDFAGLLDRIG